MSGRAHCNSGRLRPISRTDAQDGPTITPMDESRTTEMNELRERLERAQYTVDPNAVARALLERLLAGRTSVFHRA